MRSSPYVLAAIVACGLTALGTSRADAMNTTSPAGLRAGLEAVDLTQSVGCRPHRYWHAGDHRWRMGCGPGVVIREGVSSGPSVSIESRGNRSGSRFGSRSGSRSDSSGNSNSTTNNNSTTNTGTGAGATTSTKTGGATYTGAGAGATSTSTKATTTTGGATTTTGGTGAGGTSSTTGGTAPKQ
jgi:hypothetical protein